MKKRILGFLLSTLMVLPLLAASVQPVLAENEGAQSPTPEPTAEPTPKPTLEPLPENMSELEWWDQHHIYAERSDTDWFALANGGAVMQAPLTDTTDLSLYKAYADEGLLIGTDINPSYLADEWFAEKLISQFEVFTPTYDVKSNALLNDVSMRESQTAGELRIHFPETLIETLEWIKANGKIMRGHTVLFWKEAPDWFFREDFKEDGAYASREVMLTRLEEYIRQTFAFYEENGYADMIFAYDIVNEYLDAQGSGLKDSLWLQTIGEDYIKYAFLYARKYVPENIKLVYNENTAEMFSEKRDAVIALVKTLTDEEGKPLIDAIGIQCHISLSKNIDTILENIRVLAEQTGMEIQISEMDISMGSKTKEQHLKRQGQAYYNFMQGILAMRQEGLPISLVALWGFEDAASWLGSSTSPLLYDINKVEKYAYFGMLGRKEYAGFDE